MSYLTYHKVFPVCISNAVPSLHNDIHQVPRRLYYQFRYFSKWWEKLEAADPSFKMANIPEPPLSSDTASSTAEESAQPESPGNSPGSIEDAETGGVTSSKLSNGQHGDTAVSPRRSEENGQLNNLESPLDHVRSTNELTTMGTLLSPTGGEAAEFDADMFHFSPPLLTPYSN